ncbi:hypothetical protein SAVIM338S_07267 [Streptomyces avidinii]
MEVTGARTETVTLWANPEGTLTQDQATGPVRMRVGEAWVPVDTTLTVTADGKVAPKAHPEGLVFEGGDASVTVGDKLPGTASPAPSPTAAPTASASAAAPSAAPRQVAPTAGATPGSSASATPSPSASVPAAPASVGADRASRSVARAAAVAVETPAPAPVERELVKVGAGDRELKFGWLGKLPKPKLEGSRATYVDARPGVDLVLEATRTGFEQFLVVKDRAAVSQAGTLTLPLDVTGMNVVPQADGSLQLVDKVSGKAEVKIPSPVMWDAKLDAASQEHLNRAPVKMEVRGEGADTELVFTPAAAFLTDAKTQFPVTIDPVVDVGTTYDTYVQTNENSDNSSSTELKLGSYDGVVKARSFMTIPGSPINGKQILGASLNLYNFHSSSCTANQWEVWHASGASGSSRWNSQPAWGSKYATSNETYDADGNDAYQCLNGQGNAWSKVDVTGLVSYFAGAGYSEYGIGLRATGESSILSWKKFSSAEGVAPPYLSITYNTIPLTPAGVDVLPAQQGNPRYTSSGNPTFQVHSNDVDGDQLKVYFDLWRGGTFLGSVAKDTPNGTVASVKASDYGIARLDEDVQYSIWAMTDDGKARSNWVGTNVVADTAKPGAPFVTSADYPSDGLWHGAANTPGSFTFSPPPGTADLVGFVYTLDGAAPVTLPATAALTTSITPLNEGRRTLKVQAKDRAGNLSDTVSHAFQVGKAGMASPVDGTQAAKRVKLSVDAQTQFTRVIYQYRRGPGATEYAVPRSNMTKADNTPVPEDKPRLADLGAHANWSVLDTLGVGGVVQVRALLFTENDTSGGYATA